MRLSARLRFALFALLVPLTTALEEWVEWKNECTHNECGFFSCDRCEFVARLEEPHVVVRRRFPAAESYTEIVFDCWTRWTLSPGQHADEHRAAFPVNCPGHAACGIATEPWLEQLKVYVGLRVPKVPTGEWRLSASVGMFEAKKAAAHGVLQPQILLADLQAVSPQDIDYPSASVLLAPWKWQWTNESNLSHPPYDFCIIIRVVGARLDHRLYNGTSVAGCFHH